jgi:hypothetical protein
MKTIAIAGALLSILLPTHDSMQRSDWIQKDGLRDPASEQSCCGENDCFSLGPEAVTEFHGGYIIKSTGEWIQYSRVLWRSRDGQWWRCAPILNGKKGGGETRCLIAPPSST